MYGFSYSVGLFGSSHSIELHLRDEEPWHKFHETTVWQNCLYADKPAYKEFQMARLHQQMCFYISFALLSGSNKHASVTYWTHVSATHWTFHFETTGKYAVRYIKNNVAEMYSI